MTSTNQRIRYGKSNQGVYTSRRVYQTAGGQTVSVELNETTKTYRIVDASTGETVTSGGGTKNFAVLKIKAKDALTSLGVSFSEESRNRDSNAS